MYKGRVWLDKDKPGFFQPSCMQLVTVLKNESAIAEEKHHRQGKQSGKRQETLKGPGLLRQRENAQ